MSARQVSSMTEDELAALIQRAVRTEFESAGLRVEDADDKDEAREDFRFVRRARNVFEGASSKIGGALILAAVGGFVWLLGMGVKAALPLVGR